MDISNIFLLYDADGSPESPFSVPVVGLVVGFVEALVSVVISVVLAWPSVGVGVGRFKQLQIKNHNNITTQEVVQKLNKPDTNYAGVMAPVTQQPCIIKKISF